MIATMAPAGTRRQSTRTAAGPEVSEPLRMFREATAGFGRDRFRLPSLYAMRKGAVRCAHEAAWEFLQAGRRANLQRAWAEGFIVCARQMIDRLWADQRSTEDYIADREQEAENRCNVAQLQYERARTPAAREKLIGAIRAEIAEESAWLARLEREDR